MNAGQDFSSQLKCISTIEAMRTVKPRGAVTVVRRGKQGGLPLVLTNNRDSVPMMYL